MKDKSIDDKPQLTEDEIRKMFYEVKGGLLLSKEKFYKKLKAIDPTVKQKDIYKDRFFIYFY